MDYSFLVEAYEEVGRTTKRLEKTDIISNLLKKTPENEIKEVILLLQGRVFPQWDDKKIGISSQLALKSINMATGANVEKLKREWAKKGDLGIVIEDVIKNKKQTTLYKKKLTVSKVFENIIKLSELEGKGTVSKKMQLIVELLGYSSPKEAKFIIRTLIGELRIGTAEGIIRDAIVWTYFPRVEGINDNNTKGNSKEIKDINELEKLNFRKYSLLKSKDRKLSRQIYNNLVEKVEHAYNLTNDLSEVAMAVKKQTISKLATKPGIPINPMLAMKTEGVETGLNAVGSPALIEYKYDGARLQIHNDGKEIKLFTRRLENVTKQFEELIPIIKKNVKAKSFILDSEAVGFDPKTNKYLPFQNISQRIRRKYDIGKKSKEVSIEIHAFDIMYKNGKSLISKTQKERRDILEKIIVPKSKKIKLSKKLISSNKKEIENFYKKSLEKGNEGVMIKNLNSIYRPGRRVGGWLKHKPERESLDLVIIGATWGEGKRTNWLSSFTLACRDKNNLLTIGKVGTGIAEKNAELTFGSLTKELKPLIKEQKGKYVVLKPKVILEIGYDEIQKSPTYKSGYALRFPRVLRIRRDLGFNDIDDSRRINRIYKSQQKSQ